MRVVQSDLESSKQFVTILETEITDANDISTKINDFINIIESRTSFSGPGYESIKNKLEEYKTLMDKRKETAIMLKDAVETALQQMNNYMDGASEYDDTEITELENSIVQLKAQLRPVSLENVIGDNVINTNELIVSNSTYNQQISEQISIFESMIEKLKQLAPTNNAAYQNVSNVSVNIQNYNSSIKSIQEINTNNLPSFSNNDLNEYNHLV